MNRQNLLLLRRGERKINELISSWKCEEETRTGSRSDGRTVHHVAGTRSGWAELKEAASWEKDEIEDKGQLCVSVSLGHASSLSPAPSRSSPQG